MLLLKYKAMNVQTMRSCFYIFCRTQIEVAEMNPHRLAHIAFDDGTWNCSHRAVVGGVFFVDIPRIYLPVIGNSPGITSISFCGRLIASKYESIDDVSGS